MRHLLAAAFAAFLLCACGGGGGGGNGVLTPLRISADRSSIEFALDRGGALPEPQIVEVRYEGDFVTDGYAVSAPAINWLSVQQLASPSPGVARFQVRILSTSDALPGDYQTSLRFLTGRLVEGQEQKTRHVDVPVQINLRSVMAILTPPNSPPREFHGRYLLLNEDLQVISLLAHGLSWTATPEQPWLKIDQTAGTGDAAIVLRIDNPLVEDLEQTGNIRFHSADTGQTIRVPVRVTNRLPDINTVSGAQPATLVNGTDGDVPLFGASLSTFQEVEWSVTTDTPWLKIMPPGPGTAMPSWNFQPRVRVDTRGTSLASGVHSGSIMLNVRLGKFILKRPVPISLTLEQPVITAPDGLSITGLMSDELRSDFSLSLNTGETPYTLQLKATGTGAAALAFPASVQASAGGTPVRLQVDRAALAPGRHHFTLTASAAVNGDRIVRSIPVEIAIEQNRLVPARPGIALRSLPVASRLSASLRIDDLAGQGGYEFSTAGTAAWLSATPTADTGESITISADPSGLAEGFHEAELVLTPVAPGFARAERIRVGLYVGSQPPSDVSSDAGGPVALDPVGPYIYVQGIPPSGRGAVLSRVHLYTGEVTEFFTTTPDNIRGVEITPDGRTLLANVFSQGIITFDTRDLSRPGQPLPLFAVLNSAQFEQVEVAGRSFILGSDYTGRDLVTNGDDFDLGPRQELYTCNLTVDSVQRFRTSANGRYLVGDSGCVHEMRYSYLDNRLSLHRIENEDGYPSNVQVISDRGDRAYLYREQSGQAGFHIHDFTQGDKHIGEISVPSPYLYADTFFLTLDGREFHTLVPGREQVWVFSAEGDFLRQYVMPGIFLELRNSGDGARLIISGSGGFRATELP